MIKKVIDYNSVPECDVIINYVMDRMHKGLGTNIYTIGLPGTGKSSFDQRLGQLLLRKQNKPELTTGNIADSLLEVLAFIRNVKHPGEVLIIEEVSVLFPSVRAMSQDNVTISKVMDTLRKKQVIVICNAPVLKRIDSHLLALGNILVETLKVNKTEGIVIAKTLKLQTNPRMGKTYFHRFNRKGREVHRVYTRKPDGTIWEEYEKKKDAFIDKLYDRLKHTTQKNEDKLNKEMGTGRVSANTFSGTKKQVYKLVYLEDRSMTEAGKLIGISPQAVSVHCRDIDDIMKKNADNNKENGGF